MTKEGRIATMHRGKALLYKDLCDLRWNGQILFNLIAGIAFIYVFSFVPGQQMPMSFLIAFILAMLTMMMQGNMIVEEYEQRTNRRLKQVGFSMKDIVISKMLVTFMATVLIFVIFFFLYHVRILHGISIFLLILPLLITMLIIGTFLGMKTKNTIEVSLYGMPVVILYFFVEGLLMNSDQNGMPWLVIFPNYHLHYGIQQLYLQASFLSYLVVPVVWMSVIILWFVVWFRKKNTYQV